jgi:endonuclease/exonuclease/phosphatase family metal-dependent hydrolase
VRADNLRQLMDEVAAGRRRQPEAGVVVMGDLNVVAEDPYGAATAEYSALRRLMAREGLVDTYRQRHPDPGRHPGHTVDGRRNPLGRLFNPGDSTEQRLDYVLAGPPLSGRYTGLQVTAARVIDSGRPGAALALSDHHAVEVELRWTSDG